MPVTALDLIRGSIRLLGKPSEAENISAEDADNALFALNEMMDLWAVKRFLVFQIKQDLLTWPGGAASQTIGIGGQQNVARPLKLEPGSFLRDANGLDYQLEILNDREEYDGLWHKTLTVTQYGKTLYYEPSFPLGSLFLWQVPQQAVTIGLNSRQVLQLFPALNTPLSLPPGYGACIRSNLALALAPEMLGGDPPPGAVLAMARETKSALAAINTPQLLATCETAYIHGGGHYDIESGRTSAF